MKTVHVEFQRVQTWLFAVPRLRVMVGANALLGEVLRQRLPYLARQKGAWQLTGDVAGTKSTAAADKDDPLVAHDDPADDARYGIVSRDGGHFEAQFASGAEQFANAAASLIRQGLPGLRFSIDIDEVREAKSQVVLPIELPVFAPCSWTGHGFASATIGKGSDPVDVSTAVDQRYRAGQRATNGDAGDLATLLTRVTELAKFEQPRDFDQLVGHGYLAVIHADGNAVGQAAKSIPEGEQRASFFHRNRVLLRRALKAAIDEHCLNYEVGTTAPLSLLMLGGDDVLVACRAAIALPFATSLCRHLEDIQVTVGDDFHLTLGIGVVIAKSSVPFHRLHAVAEHLAASAKRKYRGMPSDGKKASIVDWAVYTATWADDPTEVRRRDWVRGDSKETYILSRRPLRVLGAQNDALEGLTVNALHLAEAPRSQLRYFIDQLGLGRHLSTLTWEELSPEARRALQAAGIDQPWEPLANDASTYVTAVLDLVEVLEIPRLGRGTHGDRSPSRSHSNPPQSLLPPLRADNRDST